MATANPRLALAGFALALFGPLASAGEAYVSVSPGLAWDEIDASAAGISHPTRCDRLLYANPADAPTDAACADSTPRLLFSDEFDFGAGQAGSISLGYAWERFRLEAEFFGRSQGRETRPGIAASGNVALEGKNSEWSDDLPPYYQISGFRTRQLFVNAYYAFGSGSAWKPFVGAGVGIARIDAAFEGSYLRRALADGYVAAVGGDPAQPEDWQIAAAGSQSRFDAKLSDEVFGHHAAAGVERQLADRTQAFLMLRWSSFGNMSQNTQWSTIRSHAPVQADGITPFTSELAFENMGGPAATLGLRYSF